MQVTLDQLLSAIMSRMDSMEASLNDLRIKTNVLLRLMKEDDSEFTKDRVLGAVKNELEVMKKAGMLDSEDTNEISISISDGIYNWLQGDVADIREKIDNYRKQMDESAEDGDNVIDVASPDFLSRLESVKGKPKKSDKGNLLF
ncbi:MAG: Uncharacterized protein XE05_0909 [Thermotogales bacterium 46_20]|nr:MAG: Uncharacterized protein XE05_0909 [Thermotogales bacterium 46_20]